MADPPYDDLTFIDAAVMLRLHARSVANERDILAMDRPALTVGELHASLERLGVTWYRAERRVLAPHPFVYEDPTRTPHERAAFDRAWRDGNAWRGDGHPLYGTRGNATALSEAGHRGLAEWRRAYDASPPGQPRPPLAEYLPADSRWAGPTRGGQTRRPPR